MKLKKIIITGAPGTGKTCIIQELKTRGYFCFEEIWKSEYSNPKKESNLEDINNFSKSIFLERMEQLKCKVDLHNIKNNIIFFDRSIIDTIAYLNAYEKNIPKTWKNIITKNRYEKTVFYCPLWKDIYTQNHNRKESFQESKNIDQSLISTYTTFKYSIKNIPKIEVKKRVDYILKNI